MNIDKVDVVILTKNSAKTLEHVLRSVFNDIPVNRLIIVDAGSTDRTLEIAREYKAEIVIEKGNLALARYKGALHVKTDWFCFIDSDIRIISPWYGNLERWKRLSRVAWIQGLTLEHSNILNSYAFSKTMRYAKYGCIALSNSLLKRDVVIDCEDWLRKDIQVGEDAVLHEFVRSQNLKILVDTSALCLHLPDSFLHDIYAIYRAGYSDRLRHKHNLLLYLGVPYEFLKEGLLRFLLTKDPRLFGYFSILGITYILGFYELERDKLKPFMEKIDAISKTMIINEAEIDLARRRLIRTNRNNLIEMN